MNYNSLLLSTCVLALGGATLARAETTTAADLDALVVTATRTPTPLDQVGASVTLIDQEAVRQAQAVVVSDLLVQTPGVSFSRNGGVGKTTSLYIRGAETDQTVVLIDGVKLNDPSSTGGGFNAGDLLAGDIARIEVLRGSQSTLWGSQAIGGVVNIITRQPTGPFEADAEAEGGALHTAYGRAGVGGKTERLLWRVSGGYYTTDGVSAFAKENGGREPDGYRNVGLNGRGVFNLTRDVSVEARAVWSKGHNEFDGFGADAPNTGDTKELVVYGGLNAALFGGRLQNRLAYAYTDTDRVNFDPLQKTTTVTFDAAGQNRRWEYQGTFAIATGWTATFGGETERSQMHTASPTAANPTPKPATARTGIDGLYGQIQAEVLPGLTLTGGLRHDDHRTFGGHTLGQFAAAWSFNDADTVVRASYGEGFKAPSLFQLYSDFGNTALKPEEAKSWDIGVEHHLLPALVVSATYFNRDSANLIDFVSCTALNRGPPQCVGRTGFYDNVSKARADGIELASNLTLGGLSVSANYTHLRAKNATVGSANFGKRLVRRPQDQANATVSYLWPFRLSTSVSVRATGASWNNAANTQRLKAYTLVDLRASYPVTDTIEVYGRIENLFEQTYQTTLTYGSPGRGAYVGARARF
ncbi:MAG TPA: TonB-dependent receptor [Caulobacteraceae bacterium]|nr:TonB-dependent receptor [Caulobacteraceae bacterium]